MKILEFDSKQRLIEKARHYVAAPEHLVANLSEAAPILLRALKHADSDLRRSIALLFGFFADKAKLVGPFCDIVRDEREDDDARHEAALQLSVIAEHLDDVQPLLDRLMPDLEADDADLRLHATCALGWRGNHQAALALIDRLYDEDERVQNTAAFALTNLRDDRVFGVLLDRLECAPREQQRAILSNLWRFHHKPSEVIDVYLRYLDHADAALRLDVLVLLGAIGEVADRIDVYRRMMHDDDERIRRVALTSLGELGSATLRPFRDEIAAMAEDRSMAIKRLAREIVARLDRRAEHA